MWHVKFGWLYVIEITILIHSITGFQPKIIIIGAGSSGIAAATKLHERGFRNVTIFEAENRIGGRVYTTRFDNKWIDLGGEWVVPDIAGNIVYELAWPLGLLELPNETGTDFVVYDSDGYQIQRSIADDLVEFFYKAVGTNLEGKTGSVKECMTEILNTRFENFPTVNMTVRNSFMNLFEGMAMGSDALDTWHNNFARDYVGFCHCPGNKMISWKDKGYGIIFDLLTKKYPNPNEELPVLNNTLLNTEVFNINYNTTNGKVSVQTSDGEKYDADHVIVTPSVGVLKEQHKTLFTPRLPELKVKTINDLAFGTICKIVLSFDEEWWSNNWTSVYFIWKKEVRQEYKNDPDKKWLLDVIAFSKLSYKPRILVGWVNGPGCRHVETLSEDQMLNQTLGLLNKFLGKSFNITRPTKILRSDWSSNRHFRGAYSYRSMESDRSDVRAEDLAAPLLVNGVPTVLFAGEATSSNRFATVHGAIETGIREANRLIEIYQDILD